MFLKQNISVFASVVFANAIWCINNLVLSKFSPSAATKTKNQPNLLYMHASNNTQTHTYECVYGLDWMDDGVVCCVVRVNWRNYKSNSENTQIQLEFSGVLIGISVPYNSSISICYSYERRQISANLIATKQLNAHIRIHRYYGWMDLIDFGVCTLQIAESKGNKSMTYAE